MTMDVPRSGRAAPADAEGESERRAPRNRELAEPTSWPDPEHAAVVLNSIGDGVLSTDAAGNVVYLNRPRKE